MTAAGLWTVAHALVYTAWLVVGGRIMVRRKEIGKGGISYRQVGDNLFGRSLQILEECYQPGSDTGKVPLVHDGEEGGIVLCGRLEVTVDGTPHRLAPGDCLRYRLQGPSAFATDIGARYVLFLV